MTVELKGALTALVTPFSKDDRVDEVALARFTEAQIAAGIDGLVPCGTTGETPTLSEAERERVVRTVIETARNRVPIVVGTGSNATKSTVEMTKRAKAWGAKAALVVCPYYNKPTQEGLFRHFKAVFDETGMPIVAYNVPGRTVSDLLPDTIARLVEVGAIVAVKDATADMRRATETLAAVGRERPFSLLSGDDFTILPFVAVGGRGVISVVSNVAPADTSRLVKLASAGKLDEARVLGERLTLLSGALFKVTSPIPVKAALGLTGWCAPLVRLPLVEADESLTTVMKRALWRYRGAAEGSPLEGYLS